MPGPDAADGRARQEPPERDPVVARQRERFRAQPGGDGIVGASARSVAAGPLRGRSGVQRRLQPHVRVARGGRRDRARRRPAVRAVRVRARDGERTGRPGRLRHAVRAPSALSGRLRLGVDRPRSAARRRVVRVRRGLRRGHARRRLLHRRPRVPGPDPVAGPRRAQEGVRAGADHGRRRADPDREPARVPRPVLPAVPVGSRRGRRRGRVGRVAGRAAAGGSGRGDGPAGAAGDDARVVADRARARLRPRGGVGADRDPPAIADSRRGRRGADFGGRAAARRSAARPLACADRQRRGRVRVDLACARPRSPAAPHAVGEGRGRGAGRADPGRGGRHR